MSYWDIFLGYCY